VSGGTLFGLMARFEGPGELAGAARLGAEAGYRDMDAFTPARVPGLAKALGHEERELPRFALAGGIAGAATGAGLQYWTTAVDYPLHIGGHSLHHWAGFLPVTFECAILFASLAVVAALLAKSGLPRPHHPVFRAAGFERASRDAFFLCIEASDPRFERAETERFLRELGALEVVEIVV
jgi:hypothetical protein